MDALLYQRLAADAPLTALIGTHLYPTWPTDDSTLPYVLFRRGGDGEGTEETRALNGSVMLKKYAYELHVWDNEPEPARAIADAIYNSLTTWHTSPVQAAFLRGDKDEETEAGFHIVLNFQIIT